MESTLPMASESGNADLRRENRRKKILQTAKARLEKLNGGTRSVEIHNIDFPAEEVLDYSDPEVEPNFPIGNTFSQEDRSFYSTTSFNIINTEVPNNFLRGKIHIFVASILGYILSHYVSNSLFVPFCLCIIIELLLFKGQHQSKNNFLSLILPIILMCTGPFLSNKIKQINYFLYVSQSVIINLAVNIFCICAFSYFYQYLSISHIVDIK